jgi:uncharacterized small protein (DUF1192 family)
MAVDPEDLLPGKKPSDVVLGQDLSHLSEHELVERIAMLEAEITRSREAISLRKNTRSAANAVFNR